MFQYVAIGILALALIIFAINVIKGLLKGLKKTVGSLVVIALSALTALILTAVLCKPSSPLVIKGLDGLKSVMPEGTIQELFTVEELGEAFSYYSSMLVKPFFFSFAFVVASIVFGIVVAILIKVVPPFKKPGALLNRLGGAGVGLICGFLVAVIIVMPLVGTIDAVAAADDLSAEDEISEEDTVRTVIHEAAESHIVDVLMAVSRPVYDGLSSADFHGERVYLSHDLAAVLDMVDNIDALAGEISQYGDAQIAALDRIVADLESSPLLENTVAGVFSTAAEKWLSGEQFIGMDRISAGEMLDPLITTMLEVLSTSDKDTIGQDLETMTEVFEILIKHEIFKNNENHDEMLIKLSQSGAISELLIAVNQNPRMAPLADDITALSIRALASTLGIPENAEERYDALMGEIADTVNGTKGMSEVDRAAAIEDELKVAFESFGVEVGGEALGNIASSIIADLGHLDTVSAEDVEEMFLIYAVASAEADKEASGGVLYQLLSSEEGEITLTVEISSDGTITVNGKTLVIYNADNYRDSVAYIKGEEHADFGEASSLYSAETMISDVVTIDDIVSTLGSYLDCEDIAAEAKRIEGVIVNALGALGGADLENADIGTLIEGMGDMLDGMSETFILGGETVEQLLRAALQSEALSGAIGLSHGDVSSFADKVIETVNNTDTKYADATRAVSGTLSALKNAANKDASAEEKREAAEKLINNITTDSAEMIGSMLSSSMLEGMGVSAEKTESVTSALDSMINNMAEYNVSAGEGADTSKEADAVNQMLNLAISISPESAGEPLFNNDGGEGALGCTAEELVDLIVSSEVVSATVNETVHENGYSDNPLGIPELSEEDKAQAEAALISYYVSNGGGEELASTLEAIAAIVNIQIELGE